MISINVHLNLSESTVTSDSYGADTHATRITTKCADGGAHTEIIFFAPTRDVADELATALRLCLPPITKPEPEPVGEEEMLF